MKRTDTLPEGYQEIYSVDLQKNKKTAVFVNALAFLIAIVLAVPVALFVPITTLFSMSEGIGAYILRFGVLVFSIPAYMVSHELIHGVTMKIFGTPKVKYGFTGLYAFAGSDDFYGKFPYITIALAPVIVFGILLGVLALFVPVEWFWVVYFIQICNLSGAAGDLFVTVRFSRFPKDILVRDSGVGMTVYSKEKGRSS